MDRLSPASGPAAPRVLALYVHIPFCRTICPYCDFVVTRFRPVAVLPYLTALQREIRFQGERLATVAGKGPQASGWRVSSIYFGGGTPSTLAAEEVVGILRTIHETFPVSPDVEVSLEANPGTVTEQVLTRLREGGVNRLSLGAQSFDDRLLQRIGRDHTAPEIARTCWAARRAGFAAINLDLMFGLPGQSLQDWRRTLTEAVALDPEHLSVYGLTIEPRTPFAGLHRAGRLPLPDEETQRAMYLEALTYLTAHGLQQYEISSYAKPGFACRHNLAYWQGREYLGIGVGAHSRIGDRRWENHRALRPYCTFVEREGGAVAWTETLSEAASRVEELLLSLRMREGLALDRGSDRASGLDLARLHAYRELGLLEEQGGRVRLTEKGLPVADRIIRDLLAHWP